MVASGARSSRAFRPKPCDLRDRALIATLTYSFARITTALRMKVEDLRPKGADWQVQLHEKRGKQHAMPCHHTLAEMLHAYIDAAGIADDRKGWLFRTSPGHNAMMLADTPMSQADAWRMIRRRAIAAGIHAPIGNHTFRDRHHRPSRQWRARARAVYGRAREPAHEEAL
jgi:integrase/recombinase XerC